MSFTNKVVLITGASSGIGAAIAISFAKEGANVVIVGRNEAKLKNVADQCERIGSKPLVIKADITYEDQVGAMVKETIETFGKIDILVNNAGIVKFGSLTDGNILQTYDAVMNINMRAQVHVTSEFVKYLIASKGNIVNISSVAGLHTPKLATMTPYYISKAALNHFTKCAALELSTHGVRVNAVCPGFVTSDILENAGLPPSLQEQIKTHAIETPLKKIAEAEEIAGIVLFLASDKAKSVTGVTYVVDNGLLLTV